MTVTEVVVLVVLAALLVAAVVVWLRGAGQPVMLRGPDGVAIDPKVLEDD